MESVTRAHITRSDGETVVRNKAHVFSIPAVAGAWAIFVFVMGVTHVHQDAAGGFIAMTLVCGIFNYQYWIFARYCAIRLTPAGLVVENALIRHEFSWTAAPTVFLGRGLQVKATGVRPVRCQAFAESNGARMNGYEGHRLVLTQILQEQQRIQEQLPAISDDDRPPYLRRFQLPDPWFIPAALAASAGVYALGLLAGAA